MASNYYVVTFAADTHVAGAVDNQTFGTDFYPPR